MDLIISVNFCNPAKKPNYDFFVVKRTKWQKCVFVDGKDDRSPDYTPIILTLSERFDSC